MHEGRRLDNERKESEKGEKGKGEDKTVREEK